MFCPLRTHIHFTCCRRKTYFQRGDKTLLTTEEEKEANAVPRRAGATALTLHDDKCDRKERSFGHEEVWGTECPDRVTRTENEVETKISLFFPSVLLFSFFFFLMAAFQSM